MRLIYYIIVIMAISACTKIEIKEFLPDIENITPVTINTQLKRIHISVDADELYHIFAHAHADITIACMVDYFDNNGEPVFANQSALLEIKGQGSADYDMKPLGILFETAQDNSKGQIINTSTLLPGDDLSQLINLRLRNSGSDYGRTMLKDLAYTEYAIAYNLDFELKYGEAIHVFINNEYYGLLNVRSEGDVEALSYLLNTEKTNITFMKVNINNGNLRYKSGDAVLGEAFERAVELKDTKALKDLIDLDNFIDYILFEDYISNHDWPGNNAASYSVNGEKFRFFLYDLDHAALRSKKPLLPQLEYLSADIAKIYQALFQVDEEFTRKLEARQIELYEQFSTEKFNSIVDQLALKIENDIPFLIARRQVPHSTMQWRVELETLKRDFERTDYNNRQHYNLD